MYKKLFFLLIIALCNACAEDSLKYYNGADLIQFSKSSYNYYWAGALNPDSETDTLWVSIQSMGNAVNVDRYITVEQETAFGWDVIHDKVGNIVDSVSYVIPDQAISGKHYIPFDTYNLKEKMKIPANKFQADIPVVMKKDPELKKKLTLQIRLKENGETKIGAPKYTKCSITIQ